MRDDRGAEQSLLALLLQGARPYHLVEAPEDHGSRPRQIDGEEHQGGVGNEDAAHDDQFAQDGTLFPDFATMERTLQLINSALEVIGGDSQEEQQQEGNHQVELRTSSRQEDEDSFL